MKRQTLAISVSLIVAGAAAVACSSKSNGGGSTVNPADTAACQALATAVCTQDQNCNPYALDEQYGDEPTCEKRQILNCMNDLAAPGTGSTADSKNACAMAEMGLNCQALLDKMTPMACSPQAGSGSNGSACAFASECSSAFCAISPGSLCGKCATAPMPGASCTQLTTCGSGLVCTSGVCAAYVTQAGSACGKGLPCGSGLSCIGATSTTMGKCMATVGTMGAACDPTYKTGPTCSAEADLTCNTLKKTCQPIAKAMPGQACGNNVGSKTAGYQQVVCGAGGAATCVANKCQLVVLEGSACDTVNGPDCMAPARCIGSVADGGAVTGMCEVPDGTMCH